MPRPSTFPKLYDFLLKLSITELKKWGYLDPQQIWKSYLIHNRFGNEAGKISIRANTREENPYLEFYYLYRGRPYNYKVRLVSLPSNLGKGKIWYFLCPKINKRCRKLYFTEGLFLHREAVFKGIYFCQATSKLIRQNERIAKIYINFLNLCEQYDAKHFREYYKGKPTKKHERLMKQAKLVKMATQLDEL